MINKVERIKLVKAMEYIARKINDEDVFDMWLMDGVADGDIEYGELEINNDDINEEHKWAGLECYITDEDNAFKDLMTTFLKVMSAAWESGGLYCGGITSDEKHWKRN